ncbi:hypothetical protein LCGC14_1680950, partial [marine sediment metagenome]
MIHLFEILFLELSGIILLLLFFLAISQNQNVKTYLNQLRSNKGKQPKHILQTYDRSRNDEGFQFNEFIRRIISTLMRGTRFRKIPIAFKKNRKPFDSPDSKMNGFEYFWFKDRLRRKNRQLGKIYAQFCDQLDFKKRYIYFAAPYQPESSTCPNAGVYEDLFLVLDILSASIPDDWTIYYKEHPTTFFGGARGSLMRNRYF